MPYNIQVSCLTSFLLPDDIFQYSPFLAAAFLLGLALISIVNTSIYAQLYQMFFNLIRNVESQLDNIHHSNHRGAGYRTFQVTKKMIQEERLWDVPGHGAGDSDVGLYVPLVASPPTNSIRNSSSRFVQKTRKQHKWREFLLFITFPFSTIFQFVSFFLQKGSLQQIKLRTRTESDIPVHDGLHLWMTKRARKRQLEQEQTEQVAARRRAPTLGAFGGFDLSLFT